MARLAGKVAIITGASRGMGAAEARVLAREGASVMLCDILDVRGAGIAAEIVEAGGDAVYQHLDVTSEAAWQIAVDAAISRWSRLDILVNNAGVNVRAGMLNLVVEDWNRILAVNLTGPLLGMRIAAPAMRASGGGAIVNIASVAGMRASRSAAYSTSKWGLRGLTRVAAVELAGWGIRVNAVCPGVVPTELNAGQPYLATAAERTPLRRLANADDVASAVLFLVTNDSAAITGIDLPVEGASLSPTRQAPAHFPRRRLHDEFRYRIGARASCGGDGRPPRYRPCHRDRPRHRWLRRGARRYHA